MLGTLGPGRGACCCRGGDRTTTWGTEADTRVLGLGGGVTVTLSVVLGIGGGLTVTLSVVLG